MACSPHFAEANRQVVLEPASKPSESYLAAMPFGGGHFFDASGTIVLT
jgi:hypothetical protein